MRLAITLALGIGAFNTVALGICWILIRSHLRTHHLAAASRYRDHLPGQGPR